MAASVLLLASLAASALASPAHRRDAAEPRYHVVGLASRGLHPRQMNLEDRLSWLKEQAEFMELRYPNGGRDFDEAPLRKRSPVPSVAPYDIAEDRRRKREKRAVATVSLLDNYSQTGNMIQDTAYLAAVGVGTPAQAFELQVDTGSSNLWVAGEGAFGNDLQTQHSTFAPASSSSFQQISTQPVNLTYGSGAVQGIAGTDSITIGPVSMQDQAVIVGQRLSSGFTRAYFDGIIGLAFSSLSVTGQPTLFENLVSSGQLDSPVFGLYIKRASDNATLASSSPLPSTATAPAQGLTDGGELVFGGYDSSLIPDGQIAYTPLLARSYWLVQQDATFVNGQAVPNSRIPSAIDSGTTLSLVPVSVAEGIADALGGRMATLPGTENLQSTFLTVPCNIEAFEIAFGFAGNEYALNITDLFLGVADQTGQTCIIGILGRNVPQSATQRNTFIGVIGDSFLKSVYSIYSLADQGSVGFGALAGSTVRRGTGTASAAAPTGAVSGGTNAQAVAKSSASTLTSSLFLCITIAIAFLVR